MKEIQEVRMGKESIVARPGYRIVLVHAGDRTTAIEYDLQNTKIKELWLGSGAFIIWKDS